MEREVMHLADEGSFGPTGDGLRSRDPLAYPGYAPALERAAERAGADESVVAGAARIAGHEVELAEFCFPFMGGSMGEVAGERLAAALDRAAERAVPFVLRTATGGARMQEGMLSLIQMPKVVAARIELAAARVPFIAVLDNPTTGGVLASLAALADVILGVAGATIGFAGPRVSERFTGVALSPASHTAGSALEHGLIDSVVPEDAIRAAVAHALDVLAPDAPVEVTESPAAPSGERPGAWAAVEAVRDPARSRSPGLLEEASDDHLGLGGDRAGSDDPAVALSVGRSAGRRFVGIVLDGSPGPGGYRKAMRGLELAARLDVPVVTLIDTRGADPSENSEAGGIAWAIARLFEAMLEAPVPVISIVTGEGGSGGALAFGAADVLLAYEGSIFSVIGPESAAEILWRDAGRAPEAAEHLKLTAHDLAGFGIADGLIAGPPSPGSLRTALAYHLAHTPGSSDVPEDRAAARRERWRRTL